jgi:hypothetical protein
VPADTFYQILTAAVADFAAHGYDSQQRLEDWAGRLRSAALRERIPEVQVEAALRISMGQIYRRLVDNGGLLRRHSGVGRFTLERVKPKLRAELERRIRSSADLIKLDRAAAIERTIQRFSGWASSIPLGGSRSVERQLVKSDVTKSLASLPFVERRVAIDQGHKFQANLSEILAVDGGALAGEWHSHFRQANYNFREEHKARDGKFYCVRGNWAIERGLMNKGGGYVDEFSRPGEEVFCRCYFRWVHALSRLPPEMVTEKGRVELARVKAAA